MLNDFVKIQIDTLALVPTLSEFIATGDWRLFFLYRDRVRKVTPADVQRMATAYILPANRVLGSFVPTEQPARAEIPPTPDLLAALAGYSGGKSPEAGEVFDPSPANIESRTVRRTLPNGIRVALLPKKTRGGNVVAKFTLHWGDESSLTNCRRRSRNSTRSYPSMAVARRSTPSARSSQTRCAWSPRCFGSRRSPIPNLWK